MSVTRKTRQTGTHVTVGHASELGLNDGQGWLTICEDHGWIVSHETLRMARHHAPDPLGWCEKCMHAAGEGPDPDKDPWT